VREFDALHDDDGLLRGRFDLRFFLVEIDAILAGIGRFLQFVVFSVPKGSSTATAFKARSGSMPAFFAASTTPCSISGRTSAVES
jgi:hypothetical protein